jgi:hypothetical protein
MAAVVRGALGMYIGARIINSILNDGDPKWDKHFSVVTPKGMTLMGADIGERELVLRSIPGDIEHLFKDPRSFVFYRVNPVYIKPTIEAVIGRDQFGRYRDSGQQIQDWISGFAPIPFQSKKGEVKIWESFLRSTGINVYRERSTFEKTLLQLKGQRASFSQTREERHRSELVNIMSDRYRLAVGSEKETINAEISNQIAAGNLFKKDRMSIIKYAKEDRVERAIKQMQIEDVLKAWGDASPEQQKKYKPSLMKKYYNLSKTSPERFKEVSPEIKKILGES